MWLSYQHCIIQQYVSVHQTFSVPVYEREKKKASKQLKGKWKKKHVVTCSICNIMWLSPSERRKAQSIYQHIWKRRRKKRKKREEEEEEEESMRAVQISKREKKLVYRGRKSSIIIENAEGKKASCRRKAIFSQMASGKAAVKKELLQGRKRNAPIIHKYEELYVCQWLTISQISEACHAMKKA